MTTDQRTTSTPRQRSSARTLVVELVAAVATVFSIVAILLNYVAAHLTFFGDPVDIADEDVRNYWIVVAIFGVCAVVAFAASVLRRATWTPYWHLTAAVVGVVVALAFAVTRTGNPDDWPEPEPERRAPNGSVCNSGGDSRECVGG